MLIEQRVCVMVSCGELCSLETTLAENRTWQSDGRWLCAWCARQTSNVCLELRGCSPGARPKMVAQQVWGSSVIPQRSFITCRAGADHCSRNAPRFTAPLLHVIATSAGHHSAAHGQRLQATRDHADSFDSDDATLQRNGRSQHVAPDSQGALWWRAQQSSHGDMFQEGANCDGWLRHAHCADDHGRMQLRRLAGSLALRRTFHGERFSVLFGCTLSTSACC